MVSTGIAMRKCPTIIGIGSGHARSAYNRGVAVPREYSARPRSGGHGVQGAALNNAGLCHARLGQFERAIALQRQAIQVQAEGRKRDYAQALGEMGSTYLLQDDYARSTGYLQQAFNIAAEAGLASDAALFARNLAAAIVALNRWDDAARFNREAARFAQGSGPASPYALVTDAKLPRVVDDPTRPSACSARRWP